MVKTIKTKSGQAVVESFVVLPVLLVAIGGLLACAYFVFIIHWCDFWVYRANICLVEKNPARVCEMKLRERLSVVIPRGNVQLEEVWITSRQSKIQVKVFFREVVGLPFLGEFQRRFQSNIRLPLRSGY